MHCLAQTWLTADDWLIIEFYRRVSDQYIRQPDLSLGKGKEALPLLTPRLEGFEAALRSHDYPKELWGWLMDGAVTMFRLVHGLDHVRWHAETKKQSVAMIEPEDVIDGL